MGLGKDETAKGSQQQRASGSADMLRLDFSLTQKTAKLHKEPAARLISFFAPDFKQGHFALDEDTQQIPALDFKQTPAMD